MMEHFNSILFQKSGPANKHSVHGNQCSSPLNCRDEFLYYLHLPRDVEVDSDQIARNSLKGCDVMDSRSRRVCLIISVDYTVWVKTDVWPLAIGSEDRVVPYKQGVSEGIFGTITDITSEGRSPFVVPL